MTDFRWIEGTIRKALGGDRRPVAMAFLDAPPPGVPEFQGAEPSSCSYWRIAAGGRTFYTVASQHFNCPVGGYTHNVLPAERMPELQQTLNLMEGAGYIRMEEVPQVYHLASTPAVIVYAPLGETPVPPDVALVSGTPGRIMLLEEAARRAGIAAGLPLLGRPTCMAVPAAFASGAVSSLGCIGNRVYTRIGEDQLYLTLRGADLQRLADTLVTTIEANRVLEQYHNERLRTVSEAGPTV